MPFIDYQDGRLHSVKLEFNLSFHCNFSCAHCSHFSPHLRPFSASLKSFRRDVQALEKVYHVDRFRFVGGEPLLHRGILDFIEVVRASSLTDMIHVCTNGSLLDRMDDAFFANIDVLSISWYPDKRTDQPKINLARRQCEKHGTKLCVEPVRYFRRMDVDRPIEPPLTKKIFRSCQIAHSWYCQTFHEGMFYLCSRPLFTEAYLERKGLSSPKFHQVDGIPIHQHDLLERLRNYIQRDKPLASCQHCLGTVGRNERWQSLAPINRRNPPTIEQDPHELINRMRMWYLLGADWIERRLMGMKPSIRLARILTVTKNLPYHWSRSFSLRPRK